MVLSTLNCITNKNDLLSIATVVVTCLPVVISFAVYIVNKFLARRKSFNECAASLYSSNNDEKLIAAIMLRTYIKKRNFNKESVNLIVALLRTEIPVCLQKTLADTLSYSKTLDGQDFQYIQVVDALIKPKSAIDYELNKKFSSKNNRLSIKKADFYHSVVTLCNLNFLDAEKAVFYSSILTGSSFKNCILRNADFRCANVQDVRFDKDCVLDGANFAGAVGLNSVIFKDMNDEEHRIIDFLDKNGIFCPCGVAEQYDIKKQQKFVFISKLGVMDSNQNSHYNKMISIIEGLPNIKTVTIERNDYTKIAQLIDVKSKMENCSGCVIFAFDYLHVVDGIVHKNIIGNDCKKISDQYFASPWLHIETALANANQLPCLIVYDSDLYRDGMFDKAIIDPNINLYGIPYSDSISSSSPIIQQWYVDIEKN